MLSSRGFVREDTDTEWTDIGHNQFAEMDHPRVKGSLAPVHVQAVDLVTGVSAHRPIFDNAIAEIIGTSFLNSTFIENSMLETGLVEVFRPEPTWVE
eukprot:2272079-Heterocapsa_arctica.AAC.1